MMRWEKSTKPWVLTPIVYSPEGSRIENSPFSSVVIDDLKFFDSKVTTAPRTVARLGSTITPRTKD